MIDILFIGAHPDDEQSVSGLLIKAKKEGLKTGIVILTKGEAGGFATKETRVQELNNAKKIMKIDYFKNLDFEDSNVEFSTDSVNKLIPIFVETQPKIIITLHPDDYHPDHKAVSKIVDRTTFVAGLKKNIKNHTWHPSQIFYVSLDPRTNKKTPDLLINIENEIEQKIEALKCYESQEIEYSLVLHAKYLGNLSGCEYAEGLYYKQPLLINELGSLIHEKTRCR
ncbi:MAG: PIG-L deacetylase family protein [Pleomorphochaeta sp.]